MFVLLSDCVFAVTKLRHFSDHKVGINIDARGESSDLLNGEEEKNDYEWFVVTFLSKI